jgi:hypothetical protein
LLAIDGRAARNVSLASRGATVAVVFVASDDKATDVYCALSTDGGLHFSAPVRVNGAAGDVRSGGEQPPRVALVPTTGDRTDIVVVWSVKSTDGTRLVSAKSTDGARTFGPTSTIPGSEGAGNRGWQSIAVDGAGRVVALWLDHRDGAAPKPPEKSAAAAATGMTHDRNTMAEKSKLYFAALDDKTPRVITASVCYCCKTSLTTGSDGAIYGVWRHVFADNQRDIAYTVSRDSGRTFAPIARVSADGWQFDGCPENGPAIAVDRTQRVHVLWPTPPDGKTGTPLALFYATSRDGRTFAPRVRITTGAAAQHAQLAATADGALVAAWDEFVTGGRAIRVAVARPAGGPPTFVTRAIEGATGNYPAIAATSNGAIVAWTKTDAGAGAIAITRVTTAP